MDIFEQALQASAGDTNDDDDADLVIFASLEQA